MRLAFVAVVTLSISGPDVARSERTVQSTAKALLTPSISPIHFWAAAFSLAVLGLIGLALTLPWRRTGRGTPDIRRAVGTILIWSSVVTLGISIGTFLDVGDPAGFWILISMALAVCLALWSFKTFRGRG